jgi:hypothetical protein
VGQKVAESSSGVVETSLHRALASFWSFVLKMLSSKNKNNKAHFPLVQAVYVGGISA